VNTVDGAVPGWQFACRARFLERFFNSPPKSAAYNLDGASILVSSPFQPTCSLRKYGTLACIIPSAISTK
jgi:hypothetical protein